jgi:thiol:disulfide interchange protein DsbC
MGGNMRLSNKLRNTSQITLATFALIASASLFAGDTATLSNEQISKRDISAQFKSLVPFTIVEINEHSTGLYEIISDKGIFYATKDGKHLFSGAIHEFKQDLPNLTALRKQEFGARMISMLEPTFVTYKAPSEQYEIVAFFDTSCGFCQKMHNEMSRYNAMGITVHYALYPRSGLNDQQGNPHQSTIDLSNVACSSNPQLAMNSIMQGGAIRSSSCDSPVSKHYDLGQWLGVQGTPISYNMQGQIVMNGYASATSMLKALETGEYNKR